MRFPRWFAIALFLGITLLAGTLALGHIDRLGQASDDLLDQPFGFVGALLEAHDHSFSAHAGLKDASEARTPAEVARSLAHMEKQMAMLRESLRILAERYAESPQQLAPLLAAMGDWNAMQEDVVALLTTGRMAEARRILSTDGERIFRRQHDTMGVVLAAERAHAAELRQAAETARDNAQAASLLLAILAGGALTAMVLGYIAFNRTHLPLMSLRNNLLALAEGASAVDIPHLDRPGTIGALARAVHRLKRGMIERDAATAALRLSEDRLKAALSIAPVAVFNLDRDLCHTWIYNPLVPVPAEEFIGRTGAEIFAAEDYARRAALFRQVLATGRRARHEVVLRLNGNGDARHYDQVVAPLRDRDGTVVGLTCAAIDVTERVLASRMLEGAIATARRADEAKARFLSAASHDLRQPLQALRLYLDLLDQRLTSAGDRKVMAGALSALAAGEELLRNYLDVSVLESGILRPVVSAVPIREILDEVMAECAPAATVKGIELRLAPNSAVVGSDPRLLRNLLRNLVANAVRYTERGRVLVGCRRVADGLRIEVWDTGIGIPEDKLAAVFEDFYQLGNRERDRTKGLGLGLSVVDRAARLLGHKVTALSRLGHGSVFTVTVPVVAAQPGKQAAA